MHPKTRLLFFTILFVFLSNGCSNSVEEVSQPLVDKTAPTTVATPPADTYKAHKLSNSLAVIIKVAANPIKLFIARLLIVLMFTPAL